MSEMSELANKQPTMLLSDGNLMPQFGLGAFRLEDTAHAVRVAAELGYRSFDTASYYGNEAEVAAGLRAAGIKGFVTSKLWLEDLGYDKALHACERSLQQLQRESIDLYLIHWPQPKLGLYVETWRALIRLKEEGRVRSIGVSNFNIPHLDRLIAETGVAPTVNQVELHPYFQQQALRHYHQLHKIHTEAWSPLGRGVPLQDRVIASVAARRACTPAQVVLRWHLECGLIVIPKASGVERMRENLAALDVQLDQHDMARLAGLDRPDGRAGPEPEDLDKWLKK